jgi:hypothetical protein
MYSILASTTDIRADRTFPDQDSRVSGTWEDIA